MERNLSIFWSFRRGATTREKETKLREKNISINNKWRNFESRSGSITNLPMSEFYMDIKQSLLTHLSFSLCL